MARATFAGGCFWGIEESFRSLHGVLETAVGYMGGQWDHPSYEQVCTGETGHAEVVDLQFDPAVISYQQLIEHFWSIHNPTSLNFQGVDKGTQYRTAIFYHSEEQCRLAEESKARFDSSGGYAAPIVTEITSSEPFWKAEEYHQKYFAKQKPGFML